MLTQVLAAFLFLFPFIALLGLYLSRAEKWRRYWLTISAFTFSMACALYLMLLWALRTAEGMDIFGERIDTGFIPLRQFVGSLWAVLAYVTGAVCILYLVLRRHRRVISGGAS